MAFLFVGYLVNQNLRVFEEELGQLPVQVPLVLVPLALFRLLCYNVGQEDVMVRLVPLVLVPLAPLVVFVQGQEVLVSPLAVE